MSEAGLSDLNGQTATPGLTLADIVGPVWIFSRDTTSAGARLMQFLPDGHIKPLAHSNEVRWRLEDGKLVLLTAGGIVSSRFSATMAAAGARELRGAYLLEPEANIRFVLRHFDWTNRTHPSGEIRGFLANHMRERGWRIGAHSYGLPTIVEDSWADLHIGAFTSIAAGVVIALGNHRTDSVTTYPFASVDCIWPSVPDTPDHSSRGDVVIGSDVWIGINAFIGSGVTIGDGAVIGAHAVVTRDVPPFAIVAGNPARLIRHRFTDAQIAALLAIRWWDWPDETIDRYLPLITANDIDAFIAAAQVEPLDLTASLAVPD